MPVRLADNPPKQFQKFYTAAAACYNNGQLREAHKLVTAALEILPDVPDALNLLSAILFAAGKLTDALMAVDKALKLEPDNAHAWLSRGHICGVLKWFPEAVAAYDRCIALDPKIVGVHGCRILAKTRMCDWSGVEEEAQQSKTELLAPFEFIGYNRDPAEQLAIAKRYCNARFPGSGATIERYRHSRIKIAYLSPDLYQHPMAAAMVGVFECHDRERFEVTVVSVGPKDDGSLRARIEAGPEHFYDWRHLGDDEITKRLRQRETDILIDLAGYTGKSRTGIVCQRCAPVQVNYLGMPGTMGAPYIDYIIADATIIPKDHEQFYSEKVIRLPDTYHATDSHRLGRYDATPLTREQAGLPNDGYVYCCFNNDYKIMPDVFASWLRILQAVPGSVLWLSVGSVTASNNLKREAGSLAHRLVFCRRGALLPEYWARIKLADLFLDTQPYGAHSTAVEMLWHGLPVLTRLGTTFAGRACASIVRAAGLNHMVNETVEEYENEAIEMGLHRYKPHISRNVPLFDTKRFTRNLEAAYEAM